MVAVALKSRREVAMIWARGSGLEGMSGLSRVLPAESLGLQLQVPSNKALNPTGQKLRFRPAG